ncbi:hypothetical protein [Agarivorans sp. QJM3NY_33]|uniref:hypothetical protein n=1 Tax=Agarivorans sp. QJM3NY_33 TaxID=3421432 RepID=UPI003D7DF92B
MIRKYKLAFTILVFASGIELNKQIHHLLVSYLNESLEHYLSGFCCKAFPVSTYLLGWG